MVKNAFHSEAKETIFFSNLANVRENYLNNRAWEKLNVIIIIIQYNIIFIYDGDLNFNAILDVSTKVRQEDNAR